MSRIPVVILPDGGDRETLVSFFPRKTFKIIPIDSFPGCDSDLLESERQIVREGLSKCEESYPDSPCVLIKDTSTSAYDQSQITSIIRESVTNSDIFYLCKWNDSCNLYRDEISVEGITTVRTFKPQGLQAVVLSPKVRDDIISDSFRYEKHLGKILSKSVYDNKYTARTSIANIFNFDILRFASNSKDFKKVNMCSDIITPENTGVPPSRYLVVAGVTTLFVLAGVGMYLIGPDHKTAKEKAKQNIKVGKGIDK